MGTTGSWPGDGRGGEVAGAWPEGEEDEDDPKTWVAITGVTGTRVALLREAGDEEDDS